MKFTGLTGLRIVELDRVPPQPWRNGGGITHELLAWPSPSAWTLRVSVATIAADGPFSAFEGIERWFTVLEGAGVELALPSGTRRLAPGDAPLHFAGEDAPGCRLIHGPTRDLNFMVQRDAGPSRLRVATEGDRLALPQAWRGLYTAGGADLVVDGHRINVPAACLAWSDRPSPWRLDALRGAAWWLTLDI